MTWRSGLGSDLLDWLAADFAEHGYDVGSSMQRILTSRRLSVARGQTLAN